MNKWIGLLELNEDCNLNIDDLSSVTRPESKPEECRYCRGTGEHHYHDKEGCHTKCERCNGTGKLLPLHQDIWV